MATKTRTTKQTIPVIETVVTQDDAAHSVAAIPTTSADSFLCTTKCNNNDDNDNENNNNNKKNPNRSDHVVGKYRRPNEAKNNRNGQEHTTPREVAAATAKEVEETGIGKDNSMDASERTRYRYSKVGMRVQSLLFWFFMIAMTAVFFIVVSTKKYSVVVFFFLSLALFFLFLLCTILNQALNGWPIRKHAKKIYNRMKQAAQQEMNDFMADWNHYHDNNGLITHDGYHQHEDEDSEGRSKGLLGRGQRRRGDAGGGGGNRLGKSVLFKMVKPILRLTKRKKPTATATATATTDSTTGSPPPQTTTHSRKQKQKHQQKQKEQQRKHHQQRKQRQQKQQKTTNSNSNNYTPPTDIEIV